MFPCRGPCGADPALAASRKDKNGRLEDACANVHRGGTPAILRRRRCEAMSTTMDRRETACFIAGEVIDAIAPALPGTRLKLDGGVSRCLIGATGVPAGRGGTLLTPSHGTTTSYGVPGSLIR